MQHGLFTNSAQNKNKWMGNLTALIQQSLAEKSYKKRFTINLHQGIYFSETKNIIFFEANEGVIFVYDTKSKKHLLTEPTLKEIEGSINPLDFFWINRSELISKQYIEKIEHYTKNTLAVKLKGYENSL